MASGEAMRVVVAARSPLLTAGLVAALRDADVDAHAFSDDDDASDAIWLVDTASQRRAHANAARLLLTREETEPESSRPEVSMRADLGTLLEALRSGRARRWEAASGETPSSLLDDLSAREREIVGHVAKGWTNQQVAQELGISANTVRTHLQNVMAKLAVRNRRELAALVIEEPGRA